MERKKRTEVGGRERGGCRWSQRATITKMMIMVMVMMMMMTVINDD